LSVDGLPPGVLVGVGLVWLPFVLGGALAFVLVKLVNRYTGWRGECPECRRWWARVFLGRRLIERKKCFGLVTRRSYSSSSGCVHGSRWQPGSLGNQPVNGSSSPCGTTTWVERVPVIRLTSRLKYRCRHCAFRWSEIDIKEIEDFDVER
jgi:hypothetical protein